MIGSAYGNMGFVYFSNAVSYVILFTELLNCCREESAVYTAGWEGGENDLHLGGKGNDLWLWRLPV